MATSQPTEIQAEGEINVEEAVKEILAEMEVEEQDPTEREWATPKLLKFTTG